MSTAVQKRFMFRLFKSECYLESIPATIFDAWAETALRREMHVIPAARFGNTGSRAVPAVRYEARCPGNVTEWVTDLVTHKERQHRRVAPNFVVPKQSFPLSLFVAQHFENVADVMPSLILQWASITRPGLVLLDCRIVPTSQIGNQIRQAHKLLCGLAERIEHTAAYGPIVVAAFPGNVDEGH